MAFQLATGLMAAQPSGRIMYASASQDPLLMASADHSRSRLRRRRFKLALGNLQHASTAIENGQHQHAATGIIKAFHLSEGFSELSEKHCRVLLDQSQTMAGT